MPLKLKLNENFEPSRWTKRIWRYTRKSESEVAGGIVLPGLFEESSSPLDAALFATVVFLEIWGLYNFYRVTQGQLHPAIVFVLFMADITLAVIRHLFEGPLCDKRNRLVAEDDEAKRGKLRSEMGWLRLLSSCLSVLIVGLAIFKVISFYGFNGGGFDGLTAGILLSYMVAALIHIKVTGYFIFGLITDFLGWMDKRAFQFSEDANRPHEIRHCRKLEFRTKAKLEGVKVPPIHGLYVDGQPDSNGTQGYHLETWGILTDGQVHAMIHQQPDNIAKAELARQGIRHQLEILDADAVAGAGAEVPRARP